VELGKEWIERSAVERDRQDQVLHLRTITKGPDVTVEEFESNLHLCNQLTDWLPGPTPILSSEELKETFFNGMPHSWSTKFRESGQNQHNVTSQVTLACMRNCQKESNAKQTKNVLKQQQKQNPSNGGRGRGQNNDRTRFRFGNNQRNVKPRHEASTVPMNDRDDTHQCYEHIDKPHTWGECFLHPTSGTHNCRKAKEAQT
jgi:hypothetical protein